MKGNDGQGLYIGGMDPVARWGATGPLFLPGTSLQIWKKITLKACRPMGATGGYFWNISKRTYIFEIFIFKKYKKEKTACRGQVLLYITSRNGPKCAGADLTRLLLFWIIMDDSITYLPNQSEQITSLNSPANMIRRCAGMYSNASICFELWQM